MNVRPLYDRIVVKRIDERESTLNGIVIPDSAQEKSQEGEVIAIGRGRRLENGTVAKITVSVGDRIIFGRFSGSEIKNDSGDFLIMREDAVLGIVTVTADASKKSN